MFWQYGQIVNSCVLYNRIIIFHHKGNLHFLTAFLLQPVDNYARFYFNFLTIWLKINKSWSSKFLTFKMDRHQ